MDTIWVTGSKGQLGTEISLRQEAMPGFNFIYTDIQELDMRDEKAIEAFINQHTPAYIINCAAYTAVDKAETDREAAYALNQGIPASLHRYTSGKGCRIIHVSTDYVFDGKASRPYTETDIAEPTSVYGSSKLAGEKEILKDKKNLVIRTSWLYSAHGNNFVKTMLRLGKEREEIGVVNDQKGTPTWAADLVAVIFAVIRRVHEDTTIQGGVYHYANKGSCTWYEFASRIMHEAKLKCTVRPITTAEYPQAAKRPPYSVMDCSKIIRQFDLIIPGWEDSLEKCLKQL